MRKEEGRKGREERKKRKFHFQDKLGPITNIRVNLWTLLPLQHVLLPSLLHSLPFLLLLLQTFRTRSFKLLLLSSPFVPFVQSKKRKEVNVSEKSHVIWKRTKKRRKNGERKEVRTCLPVSSSFSNSSDSSSTSSIDWNKECHPWKRFGFGRKGERREKERNPIRIEGEKRGVLLLGRD